MKKRLLLSLAMLLSVVIATQAYALLRESTIDYYFDDAFVAWVGYYYIDCDGAVDTNNYTGSYRVWDQYRCSDGVRVSHRCQQTDGMGGWITITCPPHLP